MTEMSNRTSQQWLYVIEGQQLGPVAFPVLYEMVRHGDLRPDCMVWTEGMTAWARMDQVPELLSALGAAPPNPYTQAPIGYGMGQAGNSGMAIASLVLGIVGLVLCWVPLLGLAASIVGLILGIKGQRSTGKGMAIAGIVLSSIGLFISAIIFIAWASMFSARPWSYRRF